MFRAEQARIDSLAHNHDVKKVIDDIIVSIKEAVNRSDFSVFLGFKRTDIEIHKRFIYRYFRELGYEVEFHKCDDATQEITVDWE